MSRIADTATWIGCARRVTWKKVRPSSNSNSGGGEPLRSMALKIFGTPLKRSSASPRSFMNSVIRRFLGIALGTSASGAKCYGMIPGTGPG